MKALLACIGIVALCGAAVGGPQTGARLRFSADSERREGNDLVLRGNVRIVLAQSPTTTIEADEATITTNADGTGFVTVNNEVRMTF